MIKDRCKTLAQNQNPKTEEAQKSSKENTRATTASTGVVNTPTATNANATNENTRTSTTQVDPGIETLKSQFKTVLSTAFKVINAINVSNVEIKNEDHYLRIFLSSSQLSFFLYL